MNTGYLLSGMLVMALVTYLIRVTPMVVFRKRIRNRWIQSFLYYVPYTVLTAMTIPAIFSSTGTTLSAALGCIIAVVLSFFKKGLLTVALSATAVALVVKLLGY